MSGNPSASGDHISSQCEADGSADVDKSICEEAQHGKDDGKDVEDGKRRKPRGKSIPREFVEVNRWLLEDHSEEEIHGHIMDYLAELEEAGGGFEGLVQHADRDHRYGAWTVRRDCPRRSSLSVCWQRGYQIT